MNRRRFLETAVTWGVAGGLAPLFDLLEGENEPGPSGTYIAETGHHVEGPFLPFWQKHRRLIGNPVTESDGTRQFFEQAVARVLGTEVFLEPIGRQLFEIDVAWKVFADNAAAPINEEFFTKHGGHEILGKPLTRVVHSNDQGMNIQVFENCVVVEHDDQQTQVELGLEVAFQEYVEKYKYFRFPWLAEPKRTRILWPGQMTLFPIGKAVAESQGISTIPVTKKTNVDAYQKNLWKKTIVIGLAEQQLLAFEGEAIILSALVSTGKTGFETYPGDFKILKKFLTWVFESPYPNEPYQILSPYVMPYTAASPSQSIHGAPWNNDLGKRPRSHGCVNIGPDDAKIIYDWAEVGDSVKLVWRLRN